MEQKKMKWYLKFALDVIVLALTPEKKSAKVARKRPVLRTQTPSGEPDEFFEGIKNELGAGYTTKDRPYLPDMGEPPE